jgi:hypothetical protein
VKAIGLIIAAPFVSGCAALSTAGVSGAAAGIGGLVGGPAGAAAGAAVGAGATHLMTTGLDGQSCAEPVTGFWPLMGLVIEAGGWIIGAVLIIPLILGYLIPNGFERKKKQ